MYTMVLMMAATTGGDTASFGLLRGSCHGNSCNGAAVVSSCTGITPVAGCNGGNQAGNCHGFKLFGKRGGMFNQRRGCHGSSCNGTIVTPNTGTGCTGSFPAYNGTIMTSDCPAPVVVVGSPLQVNPAVTPPATPAVMPKADPKKAEPNKKMD